MDNEYLKKAIEEAKKEAHQVLAVYGEYGQDVVDRDMAYLHGVADTLPYPGEMRRIIDRLSKVWTLTAAMGRYC